MQWEVFEQATIFGWTDALWGLLKQFTNIHAALGGTIIPEEILHTLLDLETTVPQAHTWILKRAVTLQCVSMKELEDNRSMPKALKSELDRKIEELNKLVDRLLK